MFRIFEYTLNADDLTTNCVHRFATVVWEWTATFPANSLTFDCLSAMMFKRHQGSDHLDARPAALRAFSSHPRVAHDSHNRRTKLNKSLSTIHCGQGLVIADGQSAD